MRTPKLFSPITWPVISFALVIVVGTIFLSLPFSLAEGQTLSYIDALFLATSAVCVTGLTPLDIGTTLSGVGQSILLTLIQLGGLGITTYTSLVFILWRNRIPLSDRLAVNQAMLNKDIVDVRAFVCQVVLLVATFEGTTALLLYLYDPILFHPFNALFHAISAFCNAGFSTFPDNLLSFRQDLVVNSIIGLSIIFGGLGFAVLHELILVNYAHIKRLRTYIQHYTSSKKQKHCPFPFQKRQKNTLHISTVTNTRHVDRYSRIVINTSFWLIIVGGLLIVIMEWPHDTNLHRIAKDATITQHIYNHASLFLSSFFQSISARTAGFATVDMALLSDASLLILIGLMFIGGAPGSCAGGIKVTTFRVLTGFFRAQLQGKKDVLVGDRAVYDATLRQALTLFFFGALTIAVSVVVLCMIENRFAADNASDPTPLLPLLFETVSAFSTVGLSMNLTPELSDPSKIIIILNMFIGRVGFIGLLTALHSLRPAPKYFYPAANIPIG